ncbi:uncharacterized protein LOC114365737 [Ostrinia furnacalis]|uniref:uncharacterized protein LOC114365737 n=1 Tax=Ostrinia furnacalis TaxID=93504 RepID=UPI00103889C0|nr:uncharacterized protein LOC114365737 [Ostrinia furnacalis]
MVVLTYTSIHSTFKFGFCRQDATARVFLRKQSLIHFPTWQSTQADYVYLIERKHSQRFRLQCIVLRIMVPLKYLFRRSRLPMYYCQGKAYYVMFNFVQVLEVHEFFLHYSLNMPADFYFEFYHPQAL